MVKLAQLKNDKNNRNIRAVIMNGSDHINVYEPTEENLKDILTAQEEWVSVTDGVQITGEDLVKQLFPMLTDIEGIEDMTKEEIADVIENPSIALLSVQTEIESILTEVYRYLTVRARKQIQDADFEMETLLSQNEAFDRTLAMSNKYGADPQVSERVRGAMDALRKAYETRDEQDIDNAIKETQAISPDSKAKLIEVDFAKKKDEDEVVKKINEEIDRVVKDREEELEQKLDERKPIVNSSNVLQQPESVRKNHYMQALQEYENIFKGEDTTKV